MEEQPQTLAAMQEAVDQYIQQFKTGYFSPLSQLARLTEELGELAREVNHYYGEKPKKATEPTNTVAEELGDLLISSLILANSLEIDLTQVFYDNMNKFYERDRYRFPRKDEQTND